MGITKRYRDPYGRTASITETPKGYHLKASDGYGRRFASRSYLTLHGARTALGRLNGGLWEEVA